MGILRRGRVGAWFAPFLNPVRRRTLAEWVALDGLAIAACFVFSVLVTERSRLNVPNAVLLQATAVVTGLSLLANLSLGLYAIQSKYLGRKDGLRLLIAIGISCLIAGEVSHSIERPASGDPLLAPVVYILALVATLGGMRVARAYFEYLGLRAGTSEQKPAPRTLIIGAGNAGETAIREIQRMPRPSHRVIGFVDDDPKKLNTTIHGVPVLGAVGDLEDLVAEHAIKVALIALPSVEGGRIREIVDACTAVGLHVLTIPGVTDLASPRTIMGQVREIEIADLLRRKAVPTDPAVGRGYLRGEVVLITGGGGSIGGELARQVARLEPETLIILGKGENSIFEVEQEILHLGHSAPVAIVADVRDAQSMDAIFNQFRPTVVFHAAAHKHVPLMEHNPVEAIRNNVFGTHQVVSCAVRYAAKKFILISTDKAVKPKNVMGATKRLAEMVVCARAQNSETDFAVVRFGNVLGSRGSLVPQLNAQIQRGGPVRITHPDMTRYFMTIPEAVQLVVQAGAYGRRGEIFILDMGEPIRVLDLAYDVIRLHGLIPDRTMPIVFTGARPGEKLHEELVYASEELCPTPHPKIRVTINSEGIGWEMMQRTLELLGKVCEEGDAVKAKHLLLQLASERVSPAFLSLMADGVLDVDRI